ncbi:MAG: helix-turn-helix transcriptional regulator [Hyphomicrobiales bacterium]
MAVARNAGTGKDKDVVIIPKTEYDALVERLENLEALMASRASPNWAGDGVPRAVAYRLAQGENAIRVWRQYRGMVQAELARKVGISRTYLTQIELGDRRLSVDLLQRIASGLEVTPHDLVEPTLAGGV